MSDGPAVRRSGLAVPSAVRLEADLFEPSSRPALAVVLCHGLPSGSPKDPDDPGYPGLARRLAERGSAAVAFSFRGCYGSDGDLSLRGWIEDLRAVVDAVVERVDAPVALAGSSLGGSVALLEASGDDRVAGVATLAAPASLDDLGEPRGAFLERVRDIGLIRTAGFPSDPRAWEEEFVRLRPEDAATRLGERPLLVVHGTADNVVPVEHAHRIARAASGPVELVELEGAGHQLRRDEGAVSALTRWLDARGGAV